MFVYKPICPSAYMSLYIYECLYMCVPICQVSRAKLGGGCKIVLTFPFIRECTYEKIVWIFGNTLFGVSRHFDPLGHK